MTTQTDPFSAQAAAEAAQFLGGGTVSAKFPQPGAKVEGTILSFEMRQQTDMDSGELLFWEGKSQVAQSNLKFPASAKPCQQLVIELQGEPTGITWETNRYIEKQLPDDDGVRSLYVKGGLQVAVSKALREAGTRVPEVGGHLMVQRGQDTKRAGSKYMSYTYTAKYTPASQNGEAAGQFLADGGDQGGTPDPFGGQPAGPNPFGN